MLQKDLPRKIEVRQKFFPAKTAVFRQFFHIFDINDVSSKYSLSLPVEDYDKIISVSKKKADSPVMDLDNFQGRKRKFPVKTC